LCDKPEILNAANRGTGLGSWAYERDSANFLTTVHYLTGA